MAEASCGHDTRIQMGKYLIVTFGRSKEDMNIIFGRIRKVQAFGMPPFRASGTGIRG